jgi:hypothetical protein
VVPASATTPPALEKQHDLTTILSHVETRQVNNDYTIKLTPRVYLIARRTSALDCGVPW